MTLNDLFNSSLVFITSFFSAIEGFLSLLFNRMPSIFGLRLGYWFLVFAFISFILNKVNGG